MSLRAALLAALVVGTLHCGPVDFAEPDDLGVDESGLDAVPVRVVAGNLATSGDQNYDSGEGIRLFRGLRPDVALVQEFRYGDNSPAAIRKMVDAAFGPGFHYYREPTALPNGVVSRWPIRQAGQWQDPSITNRELAWARIDIPGSVDLWAVSVHLNAGSAAGRDQASIELLAQLRSQIPAGDYVVVGGDFNTGLGSPSVQRLREVLTLPSASPVDQRGNHTTNTPRSRVLDHVFANPGLQGHARPTVVGGQSFANGLVFDSRLTPALTGVSPIRREDCAAPTLQHLPIVRDFRVPNDEADAGTPSLAVDAGTPTTAVDAGPAPIVFLSPSAGERTFTASDVRMKLRYPCPAAIKVEAELVSGSWTTLVERQSASQCYFVWSTPPTPSPSVRLRVSDADRPSHSATSAPFSLQARPPELRGEVVINEFLANAPGSAAAAEFVELQNRGNATFDLSGATLSDRSSVRHTFAEGTLLPPGEALVVFGGDAGIVPGIRAVAASAGSLSLDNGGDGVTLLQRGVGLSSVEYGASLAVSAVSANRQDEWSPLAPFVRHDSLSTAPSSPGKRVDGSAFPRLSAVAGIPEREPNGAASSATPLGVNRTGMGTLSALDDADTWSFTATQGAEVTVRLDFPPGAPFRFDVVNGAGSVIAWGAGTQSPRQYTFGVPAGTYAIRVTASGVRADYLLSLNGAPASVR